MTSTPRARAMRRSMGKLRRKALRGFSLQDALHRRIELRVSGRRGIALDGEIGVESVSFDQPPAPVEERRVRNVHRAAVDQRRNGIEAGEPAPRAGTDDRPEPEL